MAHSDATDGRELFQAVFFGKGSAVGAVPELHARVRSTHMNPGIVAAEDATLELLQSRDPQLFARFSAALHSGDRVRIEQMLTEASNAFTAAARDARYPLQEGIAAGTYWYHASYWFFHIPEPEMARGDSNLYKAQLVDSLAQRLATCPTASAS